MVTVDWGNASSQQRDQVRQDDAEFLRGLAAETAAQSADDEQFVRQLGQQGDGFLNPMGRRSIPGEMGAGAVRGVTKSGAALVAMPQVAGAMMQGTARALFPKRRPTGIAFPNEAPAETPADVPPLPAEWSRPDGMDLGLQIMQMAETGAFRPSPGLDKAGFARVAAARAPEALTQMLMTQAVMPGASGLAAGMTALDTTQAVTQRAADLMAQGHSQDDARAIAGAEGLAYAGVTAGLERLGAGALFHGAAIPSSASKAARVAQRALTGAAGEGLTEASQTAAQQAVMGGKMDPREIAMSGGVGALVGGGMAGTTGLWHEPASAPRPYRTIPIAGPPHPAVTAFKQALELTGQNSPVREVKARDARLRKLQSKLERSGVPVRFAESDGGNGAAAFHDSGTGAIVVDVTEPGAAESLAQHEWVHALEQRNPQIYARLIDALGGERAGEAANHYAADSENANLAALAAAVRDEANPLRRSEGMARLAENSGFLRLVRENDPGLFSKMRTAIKQAHVLLRGSEQDRQDWQLYQAFEEAARAPRTASPTTDVAQAAPATPQAALAGGKPRIRVPAESRESLPPEEPPPAVSAPAEPPPDIPPAPAVALGPLKAPKADPSLAEQTYGRPVMPDGLTPAQKQEWKRALKNQRAAARRRGQGAGVQDMQGGTLWNRILASGGIRGADRAEFGSLDGDPRQRRMFREQAALGLDGWRERLVAEGLFPASGDLDAFVSWLDAHGNRPMYSGRGLETQARKVESQLEREHERVAEEAQQSMEAARGETVPAAQFIEWMQQVNPTAADWMSVDDLETGATVELGGVPFTVNMRDDGGAVLHGEGYTLVAKRGESIRVDRPGELVGVGADDEMPFAVRKQDERPTGQGDLFSKEAFGAASPALDARVGPRTERDLAGQMELFGGPVNDAPAPQPKAKPAPQVEQPSLFAVRKNEWSADATDDTQMKKVRAGLRTMARGLETAPEQVELGKLSEEHARLIQQLGGTDVKAGATHFVRRQDVDHARNGHPNMTVEDFARLPDVVRNPDHIGYSENAKGYKRLWFIKQDAENDRAYIAVYGKKDNRTFPVTFYKERPGDVLRDLKSKGVRLAIVGNPTLTGEETPHLGAQPRLFVSSATPFDESIGPEAPPVKPQEMENGPLWERAQTSQRLAAPPSAITGQSGHESITGRRPLPVKPDENSEGPFAVRRRGPLSAEERQRFEQWRQQRLEEMRTGAPQSVGRPDLAKPGATPEQRALGDAVDALRNGEGRPEPESMADVAQVAARRLEGDPAGEERRIVEAMRKGALATGEDYFVAREVVNRAGREALSSGDSSELARAVELFDLYRESRSETARVLGYGRDAFRTARERAEHIINEAVLRPTPSQEAALAENPGARAKLSRKRAEQARKRKAALERRGIDLDTLTDEQLDDPRVLDRIAREASAVQSTMADKLYEYWRSMGLLSGAATHASNALSNAVGFGVEYGVRRPLTAAINSAVGAEMGTQLSELPALYRAMLPGLRRGWANALETWASEMPTLERQVRGEQSGSRLLDQEGQAIGGALGRAVRVPFRALGGMDELFKGLVGEMEAQAAAHAIARREGLQGEAMAERMHELTEDMHSAAWQQGLTRAEYLAYQEELGKAGKALLNLRRNVPGLRWFLPFLTTPINVFKRALELSPLSAGHQLHKALSGAAAPDARSAAVVNLGLQAAGTLGLILLAELRDEKTGLPYLTGTAPVTADGRGARDISYQTAPPMSIFNPWTREYLSYQRIDPLATVISSGVDLLRIRDRQRVTGDGGAAVGEAWRSLAAQMESKTNMQGVAMLFDALRNEQRFAAMMTNMASSFSPAGVRSAARSGDELVRDQGIGSGDGPYLKQIAKRVGQQAWPTAGNAPPAKVDLFGRDVRKGEAGLLERNMDLLKRKAAPDPEDPADRAYLTLRAWNEKYPDEAYAPGPMEREFSLGGVRIELNEQEYHAVQKRAGELALAVVSRVPLNPARPTLMDRELIQTAIERGREQARMEVALSRPGLAAAQREYGKERRRMMRGE